MCMPNYFSSSLKIYIYTTRFPGCPFFQSRALCPQSVSSGLYGGGFGFFCSLCSIVCCTAKCRTLVVLQVPRGQRTVTAPWPRSLREAGSLGSNEKHFQGPALILEATSAPAIFLNAEGWNFCHVASQGKLLTKEFPGAFWGVCGRAYVVGDLNITNLYVTARADSGRVLLWAWQRLLRPKVRYLQLSVRNCYGGSQ